MRSDFEESPVTYTQTLVEKLRVKGHVMAEWAAVL